MCKLLQLLKVGGRYTVLTLPIMSLFHRLKVDLITFAYEKMSLITAIFI